MSWRRDSKLLNITQHWIHNNNNLVLIKLLYYCVFFSPNCRIFRYKSNAFLLKLKVEIPDIVVLAQERRITARNGAGVCWSNPPVATFSPFHSLSNFFPQQNHVLWNYSDSDRKRCRMSWNSHTYCKNMNCRADGYRIGLVYNAANFSMALTTRRLMTDGNFSLKTVVCYAIINGRKWRRWW